MNVYWRITKIVLLGVVIPGGVFCFGYFFLGPNMSRMPRLDEKGWEVEVSRLKALPDTPPKPVVVESDAPRPTIKVVSSKANYRRRKRPSYEITYPGALEIKPAEATAEVPPPDGTLTSN